MGSMLEDLSRKLAVQRHGRRLAADDDDGCEAGIFAAALLWLVVDRTGGPSLPTVYMCRCDERSLRAARQTPSRVVSGATSVRMAATVSLWTYLPTYYSRAFPEDAVAFSLSIHL